MCWLDSRLCMNVVIVHSYLTVRLIINCHHCRCISDLSEQILDHTFNLTLWHSHGHTFNSQPFLLQKQLEPHHHYWLLSSLTWEFLPLSVVAFRSSMPLRSISSHFFNTSSLQKKVVFQPLPMFCLFVIPPISVDGIVIIFIGNHWCIGVRCLVAILE